MTPRFCIRAKAVAQRRDVKERHSGPSTPKTQTHKTHKTHLDCADAPQVLHQVEAVAQRRDVKERHSPVLHALAGAALEHMEIVGTCRKRDAAAAPEHL